MNLVTIKNIKLEFPKSIKEDPTFDPSKISIMKLSTSKSITLIGFHL